MSIGPRVVIIPFRIVISGAIHREQDTFHLNFRIKTLFCYRKNPGEMEAYMAFFSSAIDTLQTLVIALGAGLGVWGVVNLLEGYGSDNPGSNAHVR